PEAAVPVAAHPAPTEPLPAPGAQVIAPMLASGRCYGVDWSGAARAGDKVWVAELDPAARVVLSVRRPWQRETAAVTVDGVAAWLASLTDAWVAFDFP